MPNLNGLVTQIASSTTAFLASSEVFFAFALGIPLAFFIMAVLINVLFRHQRYDAAIANASEQIRQAHNLIEAEEMMSDTDVLLAEVD